MKKNVVRKSISNLVIGSEGFVGNALCLYLEKNGERVVRFDIKRSKKEDARVAKLPLNKVDKVYFLAWEVGGAKYLYRENTQLHQLNWNVDILRNVMMQLQTSKIPFIFISSQLAEETDTAYGATKKLGELWSHQIGGSCARLWNVYGVLEDSTEKSHVAGDFVGQAINTGKIKMMTTGEEKRQFIHVEDVCAGLHHILKNNLTGTVYDVTSFEWSTIKELAEHIGKHANAKVVPGTKKGNFSNIAVHKGKPPGWTHKISLEEGIGKMVEEAKEHKKSERLKHKIR